MIERRQRIPAEEVIEPKRWNLPYWVEPEAVVKAREKEEKRIELEAQSDAGVEEEELEIEPLTADQLEQIRQEAYNEGLEQGLVEGRQKGEKAGHAEGHKEGLATGTEEGRKLGFEAGSDEGKNQALEKGEKQSTQTVEQLESVISGLAVEWEDQKNAIEDFLPNLVELLAKAVIHEELNQGSEHIVSLVNLALNALPLDKSNLVIELNAKDLPFLEASFEQHNIQTQLNQNEEITAGGCKLITQKSIADFTLESRWGDVLKQYKNQLQIGLLQKEDPPLESDLAIDDLVKGSEDDSEEGTEKGSEESSQKKIGPQQNDEGAKSELPSAKGKNAPEQEAAETLSTSQSVESEPIDAADSASESSGVDLEENERAENTPDSTKEELIDSTKEKLTPDPSSSSASTPPESDHE